MRLGTRIFLCFSLLLGLGFYYLIHWVTEDLRVRYLEGVEEAMVDQANIFAALISIDMENRSFNVENYRNIFDRAYKRKLSAKIYKFLKTDVDTRIYIADKSGRILFDSQNRKNEGKDFNYWRDVFLTLKGKYGARTTRSDPKDPSTTILYVAAPILQNGEVKGVLTVSKPTTNIDFFLESARRQVARVGIFSLFAVFILSIIIVVWLTLPVKRLTRYANEVREGKSPPLPRLDRSEIGEMGKAFEKMREALEGKQYVEQYIRTLTHEIKSPLSSIRASAELLNESMPLERRKRFLANILTESNRIQNMVDRMLELSALENRKEIDKKSIKLKPLIWDLVEGMNPIISKKGITVTKDIPDDPVISGDPFLIKQAARNLIQNGIEFSPTGGKLGIIVKEAGPMTKLMVQDDGPGIPEYAIEKAFEKFFSLKRPDTGKKSTGLGLNFVREVAILHGGTARVENRKKGGVKASLDLPNFIAHKASS